MSTKDLSDGQTDVFSYEQEKNKKEENKNNESIKNEDAEAEQIPVDPSSAVDPYQIAWKILEGRTLTNTCFSKENAEIFDGTPQTAKRFAWKPKCNQKKGLFNSRQATTQIGWGQDLVQKYDTIVIEFDNLTEAEQLDRIKSSGLPYTMQVFSGNKSIHTYVVFKNAVSKIELDEICDYLTLIFPDADRSVLKTHNKLVRFPSIDGGYNQKLIGLNDVIDNGIFNVWLSEKIERFQEKAEKKFSGNVREKCQDRLIEYRAAHGSKNRIPCPICRARGKDSTGTNLSIREQNGKLKFKCFRCETDPKDTQELKNYFLTNNRSDPNALFEAIHSEIEGRYFFGSRVRSWFTHRGNQKLLVPVSFEDLKDAIYPIYDKNAGSFKIKISDKGFKDLLNPLAHRNLVSIARSANRLIPLQDGTAIDRGCPAASQILTDPTDFFLPIDWSDWISAKPTPLWDAFVKAHASQVDGDLLEIVLGFIFSGDPVSSQQFMLILFGPSDTGKSVVLIFLQKVFPWHCVRLSPSDCLTSEASAANLLGKRIAISSETSIRLKDSEKFRSLISGEEVRYQIYYQGKYVSPHDAIFVSATNEIGWLPNTPENRKRIRVVRWDNPVSDKEMDSQLSERLFQESAGIIVKCLKKYLAFKEGRIYSTESTNDFMERAGRNVNSIAQWLHEEGLAPGPFFYSTSDLWKKYLNDTGDRISKTEFGKKIRAALGEEIKDNRFPVDGSEIRGHSLNRESLLISDLGSIVEGLRRKNDGGEL